VNIKWIGSPNYGYPRGTKGRKGYRPIAIVYHIMDGTLKGTDSWFRNPNAKASAHYGIGRNGEIHQYVKEEDAAWHAGAVRKPSWSLLKDYPHVNPNLITIGIEHEGKPGEPFTEEMFQATLALTREIIKRWNIPVDDEHLIGHYRIDSVNRPNDPGPTFPWERLFRELKGEDDAPEWKKEGVKWLKENELITSDWDPEAVVDMGTLGTILSRLRITGVK